MKIRRFNNIVLQTLFAINYHELLEICSKYDIDVSYMSGNIINETLWNVFAYTIDIWIYFSVLFSCFVFYVCFEMCGCLVA